MASQIDTRMNRVVEATNVTTGTDYAAIFLKSIPGEQICLYGFSWGIEVTVPADGANVVSHRMRLLKAPYPPDGNLTLANILAQDYEQIYSEIIGEDGGVVSDFSTPMKLEPGFSYLAICGDLVVSAAITNPILFICVRGDVQPYKEPTLRGQEPLGSQQTLENTLNVNC